MRIKDNPIKFDIKPLSKETMKSLEDNYKKFEKEFHPQPTINNARAKLIFEERNNIKSYIIELIKQRRESPEIYINDKAKTKVLIYKDSFSHYPYDDLEKLMYIPYTPDLLNNAQVNNQEAEKRDNTKVINKEEENSKLISLTIGTYDENQTKELYDECNNKVFKYCKIEDFVNSLNNPDECNLEVINKNLLYVLYTYFFNFFGEEAEIKRDTLNEKFCITKDNYQKHKYPKKDATEKQKEFNKILSEI